MLHRLLHRARVATLGVVASAVAATGLAQTYILATPDATLNSDSWALSSVNMAAYRAAITDPANFGPRGTVRTAISIQDLATVTPTTLSGVDGFLVPWWNNAQSAPYASTVISAFQSGMDLWLFEDDSGHNGIGSALGLVQSSADGTVSNGSAPFFSGPFGVATNVNTYGNFAQFDEVTLTALGGTVIGRNASNQVTMIYWARGAFSANSGALVVFGDIDMISNWTTNPFSPALTANGILALNTTAVLVQSIPEPSAVVLLALGGLLFLGWRRRAL